MDSSSNRFKSTGDTPFFVRGFRVFRGENYSGHSIFGGKGRTLSSWKIFSGHSLFCSRFSRLSRLVLQRTLPLNFMNREEHDRHEHREIDHKNFSRLERQQTLRFRNINREQRERYEQGEAEHKNFRRFCTTSGDRMGRRGEILRNSREGENAPGGIRTHGLWFRRPTLYPPELIARTQKF